MQIPPARYISISLVLLHGVSMHIKGIILHRITKEVSRLKGLKLLQDLYLKFSTFKYCIKIII